MVVTELSRSQLVRGLAAYRELAGDKTWPPLLWSFEAGYHFCEDTDALERWERQRADFPVTAGSPIHGTICLACIGFAASVRTSMMSR
ncbi:hypothetical protein ABZ953_28775 [Streptomyces sp. NPDC046465]|uniref:hypothetical protein n=1 Tax=Streptomyces sp. NPDC046465 TaxID=3155810 RepID=UPI0033D2E624